MPAVPGSILIVLEPSWTAKMPSVTFCVTPLYTAYQTCLAKDRLSLLRVLQGGADPIFHWNTLALELMPRLGLSQKWCRLLPTVLRLNRTDTHEQLDTILDAYLPPQGDTLRTRIKEVLAIAGYRTQSDYPVVSLLLCDDAPQFNELTAQLALCWIHEYRHSKKLIPRFSSHLQILERFSEDFWSLYRALLAYREHPTHAEAELLRTRFERLFGQPSGYDQLDERLAMTLAKQKSLLMVLSHPEILLHNNPAELGARQRVRKRDVSLQARTREGIAAWDTFQTLVETANKFGVTIYQYFHDRMAQSHLIPAFATLIQERCLDLHLSGSWDVPM